MRIIGPVLGYLLSSFCLTFYVDMGKRPGSNSTSLFMLLFTPLFLRRKAVNLSLSFTFSPPDWKSDDPRWIGAWWLGALILAIVIALFALILASFPRIMKRKDNDIAENVSSYGVGDMTTSSTATLELSEHQNPNTNSDTNKNRLAGTSIYLSCWETVNSASNAFIQIWFRVEFKEALRRLLRNPVLLCSCGSSIFTILGLAGYFVWLPKYFEHEFRLSKSNAAMYSGTRDWSNYRTRYQFQTNTTILTLFVQVCRGTLPWFSGCF